MPSTNRKAEIVKSLRELTATYVANLNQCERVLKKLSQQLELEEPVSLRDAIRAEESRRHMLSRDDRPFIDVSTFCVVYRGKRCFLGNTLPFWLLDVLAQQVNRYISYEQLLADVWHVQRRSNEAIRNVAQILKRKLREAGLRELAASVDGHNRGHYGLILEHHK